MQPPETEAKPTTSKPRLPIITTLALTGLVMTLGNAHMCHLQSIIVETTLITLVMAACCLWTAMAKTTFKAWPRVGLSLLIAIAIQTAYLKWLHSDAFPETLLTPRARAVNARIEARRQTLILLGEQEAVIGAPSSGEAER